MQATLKIGEFSIRMDFDEALDMYAGVVVNHPYGVRLTAATREQLVSRFERLFVSYMGLQAA
tara:strand:- start:138 stop:323 length:186 start_codon:yes stop_codon:yes gene_type:complete